MDGNRGAGPGGQGVDGAGEPGDEVGARGVADRQHGGQRQAGLARVASHGGADEARPRAGIPCAAAPRREADRLVVACATARTAPATEAAAAWALPAHGAQGEEDSAQGVVAARREAGPGTHEGGHLQQVLPPRRAVGDVGGERPRTPRHRRTRGRARQRPRPGRRSRRRSRADRARRARAATRATRRRPAGAAGPGRRPRGPRCRRPHPSRAPVTAAPAADPWAVGARRRPGQGAPGRAGPAGGRAPSGRRRAGASGSGGELGREQGRDCRRPRRGVGRTGHRSSWGRSSGRLLAGSAARGARSVGGA